MPHQAGTPANKKGGTRGVDLELHTKKERKKQITNKETQKDHIHAPTHTLTHPPTNNPSHQHTHTHTHTHPCTRASTLARKHIHMHARTPAHKPTCKTHYHISSLTLLISPWKHSLRKAVASTARTPAKSAVNCCFSRCYNVEVENIHQ